MEKFLRGNAFAAALALFLAVILWLFVTGDDIARTTPTRRLVQGVPLVYENLEEGHVVMEMPQTVDVVLEGLPSAFDGLSAEDLEAYVDLNGREDGSHQLRVQGKPPRGLTLISYAPEQVTVKIEQVLSGEFPVELEMVGSPPPGWELESYRLRPEKIRLEAPRSIFERVMRVLVRVDLEGIKGRYEKELAPLLLDARGAEVTGAQMEPDRFTVEIVLTEIETEEATDTASNDMAD